MWHRILWKRPLAAGPLAGGATAHATRVKRRPSLESLEGRQLLTAALAPIADVATAAGMGYQLTLDGSASGAASQKFTATSDNPDVKVSVANGQFWTLDVLHLSSGAGDPNIVNEPLTFQFFPDVAPQTVDRITNFSNDGYYVDHGRYFPRILQGFVAQGGSDSPTSTSSSSGVTPIGTEVNPAVDFSSFGQLAMANTGQPNSSDAQFFVTFGPQPSLNQKYTIFGQQVAGLDTLTKMSQIATIPNASGEKSVPVNPVSITSSTISSQNPNGALLIDATAAKPGESATITVTATDPADGSTVNRTFRVYTAGPTGAVRQIGDVLIATPTPKPKNFRGTDTIDVKQVAAPTVPPSQKVQVFVNGVLDSIQPDPFSLSQILIQGSKANNQITVDDSVATPATINGGMGQGRRNVAQGGGGFTLLHGWFGNTTLKAGDGFNRMAGREGQVKFKAKDDTQYAFAGFARGHSSDGQMRRPNGTYYKLVHNRLVPVLKIRG